MKPLFKILHHSMLVNSLIPLLFIEAALILLYFGINQYSSKENQDLLLDQVLTNIEQTTHFKAHSIKLTLNEVNYLSDILAHAQQRFILNLSECDLPLDAPQYRQHTNGAFYKSANDGGSSLYVSSETELTDQVLQKAICSAALDPLLQDAVESSPIVTQAYFNSWDNIVRIYPYIDNLPEIFGNKLHVTDFNFYYEADEQHNPLRKTVWTNAYLDPAGQGWMVSAIFPIYQNNFLEGVGGLDITLDTFIEDILHIQLPDYATAMMLDGNGTLLALPNQAEHLVGLKEMRNRTDSRMYIETIEKPDEYNIIKNQNTDFAKLYQQLIHSEKPYIEGLINDKSYFMFADTISYTNWQLVMLIDKQHALRPIANMKKLTTHLGWLAVLAVIVFYALFFMYLKMKSTSLSRAVAQPLEQLSEQTKHIQYDRALEKLPETEIKELQELSDNFTIMQSTLVVQTQELIDAEVKQRLMEQEKELLTRLANTDPLTQVANRLKIEEALNHEMKLFDRYGNAFSIIMIDIDFFKRINDNYGHDMGDKVLVQCVDVLKQNLRDTDLLGRWGGEEFIAICRYSSLDSSLSIAESLRKAIEQTQFEIDEHITISLGIAVYQENETLIQLIDRADQALYKAKRQGRNQSVAADA